MGKKKYQTREAVWRYAMKAGIHNSRIYQALQGKAKLKLETAMRIEVASEGEIKVEDLISEEAKEILREWLKRRCGG